VPRAQGVLAYSLKKPTCYLREFISFMPTEEKYQKHYIME
jgi:hypothetical protein